MQLVDRIDRHLLTARQPVKTAHQHRALALAEDRRRDIVRKARNGLDAARLRGRTGGRPRVVDADKHRIIIARRLDGESIRTIANATKLSVGTVHAVLADHRATNGSASD